jgi:hypothetical protein
MTNTTTTYVIDTQPETTSIIFPRLYRLVSVDGVEIARFDVAFNEVAAVDPEVSSQYVIEFKNFLTAFNETLDPAIGLSDFNFGDFMSLASAVSYVTSRIPMETDF